MVNIRLLLYLSLLSLTAVLAFEDRNSDNKSYTDPNAPYDAPSYIISDKNGGVCFLARMNISLEVPYKAKDDESRSGTLFVPTNVTYDGSCPATDGTGPIISLQWDWIKHGDNDTVSTGKHHVVVTFFENDNETSLQSVAGILDPKDENIFPDFKNGELVFQILVDGYQLAEKSNSYICNTEKVFHDNATDQHSLTLRNVQFQSGKDLPNDSTFGSETSCDEDAQSRTVLIGIGIAIGVVILLAAAACTFQWFRRRR